MKNGASNLQEKPQEYRGNYFFDKYVIVNVAVFLHELSQSCHNYLKGQI